LAFGFWLLALGFLIRVIRIDGCRPAQGAQVYLQCTISYLIRQQEIG
jgi:hypothetical protein